MVESQFDASFQEEQATVSKLAVGWNLAEAQLKLNADSSSDGWGLWFRCLPCHAQWIRCDRFCSPKSHRSNGLDLGLSGQSPEVKDHLQRMRERDHRRGMIWTDSTIGHPFTPPSNCREAVIKVDNPSDTFPSPPIFIDQPFHSKAERNGHLSTSIGPKTMSQNGEVTPWLERASLTLCAIAVLSCPTSVPRPWRCSMWTR